MNDPNDDKTLQEYLAGNSPVSQRYRELAGDDVPAHLDELVLKQSRDAVGTASLEQERLRRSRQRLRRWSIPATLAASTVLVVSIVIESGNRHQVTAPLEVPLQTRTVEESSPAATTASDKPAEDKLEAERSEPPVPSRAVPPSEKRSKVAPTAMMRKQEPPQDSPDAIAGIAAQRNVGPAASPPVAFPQAAPPPAAIPPASLSGNSTAMRSSRTDASVGRERAAAESKDVARGGEEDLQEVSVTGSISRRVAPTAGPRQTIVQNAATDRRADVADESVEWRDQPETWLAHIRQLRADGSGAEADSEWKRFRKAHPDYAVAETDAARAKQ